MNFFKKIYQAFNSKDKVWLIIFSLLILISIIGLSIMFILNNTEIKPAQGGIIKIGLVGQPKNLEPVLAQTDIDQNLTRILFSDLSSLTSKIEPNESYQNWTIRLKENLFWSDGKKITSDDVIFTINKIKEAENNSPLYNFWKNISAQRTSELELILKFPEKYSFTPEIISNFFILPKHIFADVPVSNWQLSDYNLKPISNGPYKFKSINILKNGFISDIFLEANSYAVNYPYIKELNIKFYTNKESLLKDFNNGQINVFIEDSQENISKIKIPHNQIDFNLSNYYAIFINQAQNLALKDQSVREALSISINKENLIKNILKNYTIEANSPLPWIYNPSQNYNKDLAKKILEDNGWKLNNENIYEKQIKNETIKLSFDLITPNIDFLEQTAEEIKNQWKEIGIEINIVKLPIEEIIENNIKNRNYQMLLFGNLIYPPTNLYPFWHSSFVFWPGLNLSLYKNENVDNILYNIYTNRNINQDDIKKTIELITNDYPAIFLYSQKQSLITSKNIRNINSFLISNESEMFKNIKDWYIKTKRVFK